MSHTQSATILDFATSNSEFVRSLRRLLIPIHIPLKKIMKTKLLYALQSTLGIAVSAVCAVVVAIVFSKTQWKLVAPFVFAAVLVLLASRFGAMVSVVGSMLAAMIFALLLFSPVHSLHVENESERATLAWMILLSVSASYLLFPSRPDRHGL